MKGKNLYLEVQGIKGGNTKTTEKTGFVLVGCEEHNIQFDNFKGKGDTYKQRENPLITIVANGETKFTGNFCELIERLKL